MANNYVEPNGWVPSFRLASSPSVHHSFQIVIARAGVAPSTSHPKHDNELVSFMVGAGLPYSAASRLVG
jgi:hypothetical protein